MNLALARSVPVDEYLSVIPYTLSVVSYVLQYVFG